MEIFDLLSGLADDIQRWLESRSGLELLLIFCVAVAICGFVGWAIATHDWEPAMRAIAPSPSANRP